MKNKKLLVSLAIIAVVVVIVVVMASVFSVRDGGYFVYHAFDGSLTTIPDAGVPTEVISKIAKGKSAVFLSKTNFLEQVNAELTANYPQWYAFAVVKDFPNVLEVHLVKRTAIAKLRLGSTGEEIYLDSFGCQVTAPDYAVIDITRAFGTTDKAFEQPQDGTFKFADDKSNERLNYVLQAILATWQCYVEIEEMPIVLSADNAFEFVYDSASDDSSLRMIVHPSQGGTIEILSPETDLSQRLQKAYGVYYNSKVNLQSDDWVITVYKNGRIKTPDPNKK